MAKCSNRLDCIECVPPLFSYGINIYEAISNPELAVEAECPPGAVCEQDKYEDKIDEGEKWRPCDTPDCPSPPDTPDFCELYPELCDTTEEDEKGQIQLRPKFLVGNTEITVKCADIGFAPYPGYESFEYVLPADTFRLAYNPDWSQRLIGDQRLKVQKQAEDYALQQFEKEARDSSKYPPIGACSFNKVWVATGLQSLDTFDESTTTDLLISDLLLYQDANPNLDPSGLYSAVNLSRDIAKDLWGPTGIDISIEWNVAVQLNRDCFQGCLVNGYYTGDRQNTSDICDGNLHVTDLNIALGGGGGICPVDACGDAQADAQAQADAWVLANADGCGGSVSYIQTGPDYESDPTTYLGRFTYLKPLDEGGTIGPGSQQTVVLDVPSTDYDGNWQNNANYTSAYRLRRDLQPDPENPSASISLNFQAGMPSGNGPRTHQFIHDWAIKVIVEQI